MRVELTYEEPEWDPSTDRFQRAEAAMMNNKYDRNG